MRALIGSALLIVLLCSSTIGDEWRAEVYRIEQEIEVHKGRYARSMDRSERFRDEASWTHFDDHARYRSLMGRSASEKEYAEEARKAAEELMERRDQILKDRGMPSGRNDTPW